MTKIVYFIKGDEGEIVSFTPGTAEVVEVRLEGVDEGIISFGPKSARLKGGIARIALSVLPDGDYTPRVSTSGSHIYLAQIRKTGNKVTRPQVKPELLDKLYLRVYDLEKENEVLKRRLESLEGKVDAPFVITNQN